MNKEKSIILQVDDSTRLLMDEIKERISEDIVEDLDGLKQDVESASELLQSIEKDSQKLEGIQESLLALNGLIEKDSSVESSDRKARASDVVNSEAAIKQHIDELSKAVLSPISIQTGNILNTIGETKALIDTIKQTVESDNSPELLNGIQERVDVIIQSLETFSASASESIVGVSTGVASLIQAVFPGLRQQNEIIQNSIDDSKTLIGSIKSTIESDNSPELLNGIQERVGTMIQAQEGFSTRTVNSFEKLTMIIQRQAEDLKSFFERLQSIESTVGAISTFLKTIDDRERKNEEVLSSLLLSQKENQTTQLRILYHTTSIWNRKLRKQLKQKLYELESNDQ